MTVKELRAKLSTVPEWKWLCARMITLLRTLVELTKWFIFSGWRKMERLRWYCTRRSQIYFV